MIFSAFFAWVSQGWLSASFTSNNQTELANLFILYGLGFASAIFMYALLYRQSLKKKDELLLNDL